MLRLSRYVHRILLATAALWLAAPMYAGTIAPGSYRFLDHGDGALGTNYGLRADSLDKIFSVEQGGAQVILTWDGGNAASIAGTVYDTVGMELWAVSYNLSGVVASGTQGFTATAGMGSLTDPQNNVTLFDGKANASGEVFLFLADGHRLDNDFDSPVGRGWLEAGGTNDWLVRATPVPEPSTALLASVTLLAVHIRGRFR